MGQKQEHLPCPLCETEQYPPPPSTNLSIRGRGTAADCWVSWRQGGVAPRLREKTMLKETQEHMQVQRGEDKTAQAPNKRRGEATADTNPSRIRSINSRLGNRFTVGRGGSEKSKKQQQDSPHPHPGRRDLGKEGVWGRVMLVELVHSPQGSVVWAGSALGGSRGSQSRWGLCY